MINFFSALGVIIFAGTGWWLWSSYAVPRAAVVDEELGQLIVTSSADSMDVGDSVTAPNIYRNEEWGFQFEYPKEWEVREPAFVSGVSLFNMAIGSAPANGITINITPKNWIEGAMTKMKARGVVFEEIFLDGKSAYKTYDKDGWSRPAILTLVLVNDEYWIDITGISKYEEEYNQIIESFEFIE